MKIMITMPKAFPYGAAYALRMKSFVSALEQYGNQILVVCEKDTGGLDPDYYNHFKAMGHKVFSIGSENKNILEKNKKYITLVQGVMEAEEPDILISSSMYDRFWSILRNCNKHNIPLIIESCECFHSSTFRHGLIDPHFVLFSLCWGFLFKKSNGVIAISRYIEKHYKKHVENVIRIPTIIDIETTPCTVEKSKNETISLLFAGSLARTKDSIKEYVEAAYEMGEDGKKFEFNVYGVDEQEIIAHLGEKLYQNMKKNIHIYGYAPQNEINAIYQANDYGIFFRRHIRSSEAGFSTKLGEGMAAGTPFIVNDTGDISLYIQSGINGYVIKDESIDGIKQILRMVLSQKETECNEMRKNARNTATHYFNSRVYAEHLNSFVNTVVNKTAFKSE